MTQKEIRSKIKNAFYNYEANKSLAAEWMANLSSVGLVADYSGIKVKSSGSNAIEAQILLDCQKQMTAYRWCKVVENTIIRYKGEHKDKLIELFYFRRMGATATARRLNISRPTLFRWLNEIALTAEMWAREYKVVW